MPKIINGIIKKDKYARQKKKATVKSKNKSSTKTPSLEIFLEKQDYIGASIFLNFSTGVTASSTSSDDSSKKNSDEEDVLLWKGYCAFHNNDFETAQEIYISLLSGDDGIGGESIITKEVILFLACVYYNMQMYSEALEAALDFPDNYNSGLKHRLIYHLSHKLEEGNDNNNDDKNNSETFLNYRQKVMSSHSIEDQLCHAAMLFDQYNYQQACEIYKRMLAANRNQLALNLYIAMCYFKMDYYDISLEALMVYQQSHGDSIVAKNLRACNLFRLYNGNAALDEVKQIEDLEKVLKENDLLRHNMVVFTDGQRALQVLPCLINLLPEAKLNLAIYYLRNDEASDAAELLEELEPSTPQECILKGITLATDIEYSEDKFNQDSTIEEAKSYFQSVGTSPKEADTIPGRQCMAQFHFLQKEFNDVNIYLGSIQSYMCDDDIFNWNYGQSLTSVKNFAAAEEVLLAVHSPDYRKEICYIANLCRSYIMNGKANKAWDLISSTTSDNEQDSKYLLELIANDCYRTGKFIVAAKAFDALYKIDNDLYVDPLIGACVGAFRDMSIGRNQQGLNSFQKESEISAVLTILSNHVDSRRVKIIISAIQKCKKTISKQ